MKRQNEYTEITTTRLNVKELQALLTDCDPEAVVVITVGNDEEPYRRRVTKAYKVEAVAVLDQNDKPLLGTEVVLKTDGPVY